MGQIDLPKFLKDHKKIVVDTMVFIYQFEAHPKFSPLTHRIFVSLEEQKNQGFLSTISLMEVLVKPKRERNYPLVLKYQNLLNRSPWLKIIDVTQEVADLAAGVRAKYNLGSADSLVVATGLSCGATGLITADKKMSVVKEIKTFILK